MKEHLIQLKVKSDMKLDTLIKNFPPTILVKNTDESPLKTGHRLDVIYVTGVIKIAEAI